MKKCPICKKDNCGTYKDKNKLIYTLRCRNNSVNMKRGKHYLDNLLELIRGVGITDIIGDEQVQELHLEIMKRQN